MQSSHPVFGRVVKGMEIVDAIAKVETNAGDVPVEPIVIEKVEVRQS
jgi:cyclophilin family peptidyl-prolyl cis-trans isomerase